ncbi:hypothetical protein BDV36DRAFT_103879 [Aspergillus pseudocaelatus]|uniref:Zn(2)-C6 fungal-type domain-containing protein n=1 Tax=Aspergillus pseudocaelatus TaxID=1825620 RepID=A0ABQ6W1E0_9EURO|nr:hypothetical protein BDV36DRAFT_103879 [Aspergillus pseudocaelatus]
MCQKCHARKVRCPGGQPCRACVQLKCESECVYPKRDRQIKVRQSYVEELLRENKALRSRLKSRTSQKEPPEGAQHEHVLERGTPTSDEPRMEVEEPTRNPLLHERLWFLSIQSSNMPILIGEAADAAFATRVRQALLRRDTEHIPRVSYPKDEDISWHASNPPRRLSSAQARFLLRTTLTHLQGCYHIVRKSAVTRLLDQFLREPSSLDMITRSKLYAIFALGELYSSRFRRSDQDIPGQDFFQSAMEAYGLLQERPSIDYTEVSLLLSLFSLCTNRRHSAYILCSSAMRHCIVLGLHFNLAPSEVPDATEREHLKRIWWTAYVLDYTCAAISSLLLSIPDDEVFTDPPAVIEQDGDDDFQDTELLTARIRLVSLGRNILKAVYGRRNIEPFVQRVQRALRDLRQWLHDLPVDLQMHANGSRPKDDRLTSLHLFFNQCLILATRPVLLYILSTQSMRNRGLQGGSHNASSDNARALAEACIRCARHSYGIINDSWIRGSYWAFDYFHTQYLFSAATILGISSLLGQGDAARDREDFEFAGQLLGNLRDCGSFSAMELYRHFEAVKTAMGAPGCPDACSMIETGALAGPVNDTTSRNQPGGSNAGTNQSQATYAMTSWMALSEPSLEAFLTETEPNLGEIDFFFDGVEQESLL